MRKTWELIARNRHEVVRLWMEKVAGLQDGGLTRDQLLDTMHLFIDEILVALREGEGHLAEHQRSSVAREHGFQRQQLQQPLPMLIREYGLFLEAVVECAEGQGHELPARGLVELSRHLYTGAAEAAGEFVRRHEAERQRRDFERFAFIAHELRNPLSSVKLGWETIQRRGGQATGRIADTVTRNLARVTELIDQSLVEVRLQGIASGDGIDAEALDVRDLLRDAEQESTADAEAKEIAIEVSAEGAAVKGSARLLRSAVTNLLRNAVKFTRAGGRVHLRSRVVEGRVLVEVEDECGGLPPDKAERVFDAFSQAGQDRSGFGLGLAIAKQAAEAHGGTIIVKNLPDKGCVFVLDLPPA
jgi:hypothetical protein